MVSPFSPREAHEGLILHPFFALSPEHVVGWFRVARLTWNSSFNHHFLPVYPCSSFSFLCCIFVLLFLFLFPVSCSSFPCSCCFAVAPSASPPLGAVSRTSSMSRLHPREPMIMEIVLSQNSSFWAMFSLLKLESNHHRSFLMFTSMPMIFKDLGRLYYVILCYINMDISGPST